MKFLEYGEEFLFDDMPKLYNPTQKVFITRLSDLPEMQLPKKIPKIYTTKAIGWRMKMYFKYNNQLLTDENFVYLNPAKNPHMLRLSDDKRIRVYVFEESSATRNIMILLQKDGKITHFYAGACVHMRDIIISDTFATCISMGVEKLYMDLRLAASPCNPCELNDIIEQLDSLLHKNKFAIKIQLLVPLFANEELIAELGYHLRCLVHLNDIFLNYHGNFLSLEHFQSDMAEARVFVELEANTEECLKYCHGDHKLVTIKLTTGRPTQNKASNYFELHYSPMPSSFTARLLAATICPAHIYGITFGSMMPPNLPDHLRAYCRIPGKRVLPKKGKLAQNNMAGKSGKPLPPEKISPDKGTPAAYCIRKTNFEYMDDDDDSIDDEEDVNESKS